MSSTTPFNPIRPTRDLTNHVAIVTGAGCLPGQIGNGRATALLLAADGCNVVCVDITLALAQETATMIQSEAQTNSTRATALALAADVSSESACQQIIQETIQHYNRLDILVNGVGIGGCPGTALDVDMSKFAQGFQTNVYSMVHMAKYSIPLMNKNVSLGESRGWRGSIVNLASVAGLRGGTPHLLYPTSKGAVVQMTRAMAFQHADDKIRVNCVCPGMVYTPMMYGDGKMTEETRQGRRDRGLLKTEGNAWDIGAAVRFLAGDEARWITGVDLVVDAGLTCAVRTDIA